MPRTNQSIAVPSSVEHERKFLLASADVAAFLGAITDRLQRCVFDPQRPVAFARTTYFDTHDLADLRATSDHGSRHLRVREYASAAVGGALRFGACSFLELKERRGRTRRKLRLQAPPAVIERLVCGRGRLDELTRQRLGQPAAVDALARLLAARAHQPQVATWYRRTAFVAEASAVRITVDRDVAYLAPGRLGRPGEAVALSTVLATGPEVVLEVKHLGAAPSWLDRGLAALPEARGFSKFRHAMAVGRCAG